MQISMFSQAEHPASPTPSPDSALDWMTRVATSCLPTVPLLQGIGPSGWFLRTSMACSPVTPDSTLQAFWDCSAASKSAPPPDGWKSGGIVAGYPSAYGLAWRVLDAEYVRVDGYPRAVPQRRKRVFVVGCLGNWRRAAAVLLERESLRGDPAPGRSSGSGVAGTISPGAHPGGFNGIMIPFDTTQITSSSNYSHPRSGDAFHPIVAHGHPPAIAFGGNNTSGPIDVATACRAKGGSGHGDFESETFVAQRRAIACPCDGEVADPISASEAKTYTHEGANFRMHNVVQQGGGEFDGFYGVRRLMPVEVERLQGFADGYTAVPYRGAPAKDGPRYAAIGNSWAINVARWVGMRIQMVDAIGEVR